ncbi:MAG: aspartate aminotransferase family protein [Bacteroidota bacterium]|nr:aspartate aminotransferase family protein [Flavobacteriaceae bacterium]MEC8615434.1 aspartate aminotransferase family protein [Bacteroidota bacterium]|tara:strand:+ start:111 stop:1310 length:1200 start_codon:yes stop_codon:yes gene_type:complete
MKLIKDFLKYQAKTTPHPLSIEIKNAFGSHIVDSDNKKYLDFIAGVSVCNLGHSNPVVIKAIEKQIKKYMHVMVYGEFALEPSVKLSKEIVSKISKNLEVVFLTNSGTEAVEGSLKLAKRFTGRKEIIAAYNSYHGSTHGSLSTVGVTYMQEKFQPLLPMVNFINFNQDKDLYKISSNTACVILETIQGGAGFILPEKNFLKKVKKRCKEVGALLILDEIQPGFGRTGKLFGYQNYDVEPDILIFGKAFGGGLPIGGFCSSKKIMNSLSFDPKLGHISTFGGNPVISSASYAAIRELYDKKIMNKINSKEKLFRKYLKHPLIKKINGRGLMLALILQKSSIADYLVKDCLKNGLILFWLLWEKKAVRITPPLTIQNNQIKLGCQIILNTLNKYQSKFVN